MNQLDDLVAAGLVDASEASELAPVAAQLAVSITPQMAALAVEERRACSGGAPISQQFLPQAVELRVESDALDDPVGDDRHAPVKGVVHRYPDRCLLMPVQVCAVYCRFCFRKAVVGPGNHALTPDELLVALDYIRGHSDIWEVILTGGDPLVMKPRSLARVLSALDEISHVQVVRLHSRVPCVDPARITDELVRVLRLRNKPTYVAIHANHAKEFTSGAVEAIARLADAGIALVSQTVLLRGVNDSVEVMSDLMRVFVRNRIKPYYVHHPDKVQGTSHLGVSIEEGRRIMAGLRGRFSGLCQPMYVLDIPGGYGKVPIGPEYLSGSCGCYKVADSQGILHDYQDFGVAESSIEE